MQDNTFSTKQDLHFSEVLNYWFDSFKYFTNKNRFNFLFFDSPQMEMAYLENYYTIQERMEFIKGFKAFDEINKFIKITFNGEKSRCEGFLIELRQSVERLEFSKTECWLKSMIENFENENTQFDSDMAPTATYRMMHELYYLSDDAVSDCNKIFALYSNLPSVLPSKLFNQMNTPPPSEEEINDGEISEIQLFHFEIALLYHYLEIKINDGSNANAIAKKYQQGSGEELMKQVKLIENAPLTITTHKFSKRYHKNIIDKGLLDIYPKGKEKAVNALKRIM